MAIIISADKVKETLPGYNPARAAKFHKKSARIADKEYGKIAKIAPQKQIILMAGGSASGKTEYVSEYLEKRPSLIVFDGTLSTFKGANIKIRKALKADKHIEVNLILPDSLVAAFNTFMNRDRKFPESVFYQTHSGSRQSVLEVSKKYPSVPTRVFISTPNPQTLQFKEVEFSSHGELIEYLESNQYTAEKIMDEIRNHEV